MLGLYFGLEGLLSLGQFLNHFIHKLLLHVNFLCFLLHLSFETQYVCLAFVSECFELALLLRMQQFDSLGEFRVLFVGLFDLRQQRLVLVGQLLGGLVGGLGFGRKLGRCGLELLL